MNRNRKSVGAKLTADEFMNLKKYSKYKNKQVTLSGVKVDSEWEARRKFTLQTLSIIKGSGIENLDFQINYVFNSGIKYRCDFYYTDNGKSIVEDAKGFLTPVYRLKRTLFFHEILRKKQVDIFRESFASGEIFDWKWNIEKRKAVRTILERMVQN